LIITGITLAAVIILFFYMDEIWKEAGSPWWMRTSSLWMFRHEEDVG
jgi:hypothetical protein